MYDDGPRVLATGPNGKVPDIRNFPPARLLARADPRCGLGRIAGDQPVDNDRLVELSVAMALQAEHHSLRRQGKPPRQVAEKTLIAQLHAEELLLDRNNQPAVQRR
jgi:hypothetical protein